LWVRSVHERPRRGRRHRTKRKASLCLWKSERGGTGRESEIRGNKCRIKAAAAGTTDFKVLFEKKAFESEKAGDRNERLLITHFKRCLNLLTPLHTPSRHLSRRDGKKKKKKLSVGVLIEKRTDTDATERILNRRWSEFDAGGREGSGGGKEGIALWKEDL